MSAAFKLSEDVKRTTPPAIPAAHRWKDAYPKDAKHPLLDMSQGVPGNPPPDFVLAALAREASTPSNATYGPIMGSPSLQSALATEMRRVYSLFDGDVQAEDVAITMGCNLAFVAVMTALCEKGDEVIIPVPWYFNQQQTMDLHGIIPVLLPTSAEAGFQPRLADCEPLITPKTRAIVLVSPNNPTGAVYPPTLIHSFALFAKAHNLALILDETYRDFIGHKPHELFSRTLKGWEWRKHLIHMFSFSKSYAVPGHRVGAIVAGPEVLEYVEKVLDCVQICPPQAIQQALAPSLPLMLPFIQQNTTALSQRHDILQRSLPPRWPTAAQGGFFAFVRHPFVGHGSFEVCARLALELGLVGIPGAWFTPPKEHAYWGGEEKARAEDRWIRFSISCVSDEQVRSIGERLVEAEKMFGWDVEG